MEEKVRKLLEKFKAEAEKELGANLKSILVYGSLARGEFISGKSDINLLLVLEKVELGSLIKIGRMMRRYRAHRFATPIVVDEQYLKRSLDVFPIEFEEMKRHHLLLFGEDYISRLEVSRSHLRLQLERELKQNLLWLRELIISHPGFSRNFLQALLNASRSLSAQLRALQLLKKELEGKEIIIALRELTGADFPALSWLVSLRQAPKLPKKSEVVNIMPALLEELEHLVRWVDQLEIELGQ